VEAEHLTARISGAGAARRAPRRDGCERAVRPGRRERSESAYGAGPPAAPRPARAGSAPVSAARGGQARIDAVSARR
jgi:hypothetical protein